MSAPSTNMRFGLQGAGEPLRTNSLQAYKRKTKGFEVLNLLWMNGYMDTVAEYEKKGGKLVIPKKT